MSRRKRKKRKNRNPAVAPQQIAVPDLIDQGKYAEATEILRARIAVAASDEDRRLLGRCLAGLKDYDGALAEMAKLAHVVPFDVLYKGWLQYDKQDIPAAKECFRQYIQIEPNRTDGYYWLGLACDHWKFHDQDSKRLAIESFRKAIACDGCHADAYIRLAHLMPWDDEGQKQKSAILRAALEKHPESEQVRLDLAKICVDCLGAYQEGLDILKPLLDRSPAPSQALWRANTAYLHLGKPQQALACINSIPAEHIEGGDRGWLLGAAHIAAGDLAAALKAFSTSIVDADASHKPLLLFARADVFIRMGQPGPALDDAKNAAFLLVEAETEPWTDPVVIGGEPEWIDTLGPITSVCDALLDNENAFAKESVDQQTRGALFYVLFKIKEDAEGSSDHLLNKAIASLEHPVLSGELVSRCLRDRQFADALTHHFVYCRWKYRRTCQDRAEIEFLRDYTAIIIPEEDEWPTRKDDCKQLLRIYLSELETCDDPTEIRAVFAPTYMSFVRECLRRKEMYADLAKPAAALLSHDRSDPQVLWDWAYANHRTNQLDVAEAAYRELLRACPKDSSALHNLSLIVAQKGAKDEAFALSEQAATLAPNDEIVTKRHAQLKSQRDAEERERQLHEDWLRTAVQRWPNLKHYQRQLLCTLSLISSYDGPEHLAKLSGMEEIWVERHLGVLEREGMLLRPRPGVFEVNPHVLSLLEREKSHAVVTKLIHGDENIAFKPIFNSKQEHTVYRELISLFPNHLVFPNMALQTVFQYERMRGLLTEDEFGFYLRSQVDFCITSTANYLPLLAIEVDGDFHDQEAQKARDAKKDRVFCTDGVPLLRIRGHGRPTAAAIRNQIVEEVRSLGDRIRVSTEKSAVLTCLEREIDFDTFGAESEGTAGPRWLTVSQAASIAGVNAGVITRAVDSGELLGNGFTDRERRVDAVDLAQWVLRRAGRPEPRESDAHVRQLVQKHVTS